MIPGRLRQDQEIFGDPIPRGDGHDRPERQWGAVGIVAIGYARHRVAEDFD